MKTHGKIDFDNCHPYEVTPTIYMAHNGVLSTGNDADDSRSDTWHFINYVLGPTLTADGELLLDNGWQQFVGAMIGASNKFGFMTANGDAVIINRKSGVEFQGAWLSNTYAWNSEKYGFGRAAYATSSYSSPYRYVDRWEGYDWELGWEDKSSKKKASRDAASPAARENAPYQPKGIGAIIKAARNSYLRNTLEQWVIDAPQKAAALINAIEDDCTEESGEIAYDDVQTTAAWIADWFDRDGYDPMSDTPDDSDDHVLDAPDNRIGSAQ
ncbi:hypothetical protein EBT31_22060 [bacterium]|nr:hypothetical protein [bacterium]